MGKNGEKIELDDGSHWTVENENENLYAYYPNVILCPSIGKLIIGEKVLDVQASSPRITNAKQINKKDLTAEIVESHVNGEFVGWDGTTLVKLTNGQIWQQNQYYHRKYYAYMPKVFVFSSNGQYRMKVNGIDKSVGVKLIK